MRWRYGGRNDCFSELRRISALIGPHVSACGQVPVTSASPRGHYAGSVRCGQLRQRHRASATRLIINLLLLVAIQFQEVCSNNHRNMVHNRRVTRTWRFDEYFEITCMID
ncbi:hypothetical protein EVAR_19615_1 [Eumeta japonica]|uniref:Uncharacterized protein n=1 Tax=Eumeta variegata TaxID=151549 RepID=A0A4C1UF63_EUMVA|nr:hypothetical protein EVAR_19615_1 [Eumeta japonica]